MENLVSGDLAIEVYTDANPMRVVWRGKSTQRDPGLFLKPFFQRLVSEAAARGEAVEMHFESLEHFNSSTITTVIAVIEEMRQHKVKLEVVYNGALRSQRLSFDALRIFVRDDGMLILRGTP